MSVPILRLALLALALVAPAAARAADGGVHLYLQPLPPEAGRLTFSISSVAAVASNGTAYPLDLKLAPINQRTAGRQRLLATARIPSGAYTGFAITIKQASLKRDAGDVALAVPDTPVAVSFPFATASEHPALVWLQFAYAASVAGGYSFTPVFDALTPSRPIAARAVFVANAGSNTITVVDKQLAQAAGVIDTCSRPAGMALDQSRRQLYVVCPGDDKLQTIDVAAANIIEQVPLSPGDGAREIALTPDGSTLITVNSSSNSVTFFSVAPLTRIERVVVGNGPSSVVIDPPGRRAFVFNALGTSISVIDISRRVVAGTIATESAPLRGQFNARGDRLFVVHERSPYITVVDPDRLATVRRARLTAAASALKADVRRGLLYVAALDDDQIEFYNQDALLPVDAVKVDGGVAYLTVDPEQDHLYAVVPERGVLAIARLGDRKIASEIDVGARPGWVAVMGEK